MFETQRNRYFPLPEYDLTQPSRVTATIHGCILDEQYTRCVMERADLTLDQVMLLDKVQEQIRISREEHGRLKAEGLVEGRNPNLFVSRRLDGPAQVAQQRVFSPRVGKQKYLDSILALVRDRGPVGRKQIDAAVVPMLPDRLTDAQKRTKVRNLLQDLRVAGRIVNQGSRTLPAWVVADPSDET